MDISSGQGAALAHEISAHGVSPAGSLATDVEEIGEGPKEGSK